MVPCRDIATRFTFHLEGAVTPKARPRVTSRGTFMPPAYRAWKSAAIACLRPQAIHQGIMEPIPRAAVSIVLTGKHSRRSDLDNLSGSILDSLVQAQILRGDNLTVVDRLSIALDYDKRSPVAQITLELPL